MNRTSTLSLGALLAALALPVSLAQDGQDDTRALAAKYLDVSGNGAQAQDLRDALIAQIKQQPRLPPGFLKAFEAEARTEDLQERLVALHAETLDAETLKAAIAFYETPAGRKLAQAQPAISKKTREASEAWTQACVNKTMETMGLGNPMENLEAARRNGNEAACIGALKTISTAQALYREADKDGNGELDYAPNLEALGKTNLIDAVLASGTKNGYTFKLCHGSAAPEFIWMAIASPTEPGETGERHFAVNHEGVVFYRTDGPFTLDTKDCKIEGGTVVGR